MTIQSSTSRVTYVGDNVSTVFAVPFLFFANADVTAVKTAAGGAVTTLTLNVDYTLTGAGVASGGTLTKTTALLTGETLGIFLDPPRTQLSHYLTNDIFPAATLEANLDREVQISQRLYDLVSRAIRAPDSDNAPGMLLASATARKNTYPHFNNAGDIEYVSAISGLVALSSSIIGTTLDSLKQTAAEAAAGVTPTNFAYAPLDVRRYGGDPAGVADSTTAFNNLLVVMLQLGGASAIIWPGTYKVTSTVTVNLSPNSGPTAVTYGLHLFAEGVVLNYTGTGYAFDFVSPNTAATYGFPLLEVYGANLLGTSSAAGGFRTRSVSAARWHQVKVQGFTTGPAWTMLNDVAWSENCHWRGCAAVNCQSIIAFQRTGGTNSFARTYVDGMFGAGISNYWFDVGGTIPSVGVSASVSLYDSRFTHVSGNFTSLALFGIGNSTNASDMTATVIDGLDYEINALPPSTWSGSLLAGATTATLATPWPYPSGTYTVIFSDAENRQATYTNGSTSVSWTGGLSGGVTASAVLQQGIIQLRDYPQNAGVARRPILTNIGQYATFNGSSNNPVWISNTGASLPTGPEGAQIQYLTTGPIFSEWGQSQLFEPNFSVAATINAATYDSVLQSGISLTGFASPPIGRVLFSRVGNWASLKVFDPLTGTSNANTMTLTTIPVEYRPATACTVQALVVDNGSNITPCYVSIATSGVMSFAINTAFNVNSLTGFTATGTKGLPAGIVINWPLT